MIKRSIKRTKLFVELNERVEWIKALFSRTLTEEVTPEQRSLLVGADGIRYTLFSTISFVASFYLVHILITLFQVFYLRANGVNLTGSFQWIRFLPGDQGIWDETMIFIAYGMPYLVSVVAGGILSGWLAGEGRLDWRIRIFFTWLAIHAIMQFAGGAAYAALFYDGFGIAYLWLFSIQPVRIGVTFFVLLVLFATGSRWMRLFFKGSPSRVFFNELKYRYKFFWFAVLIPWLTGSTFIMLYLFPPANRAVFIQLFCYLLILGPMLKILPLVEPPRLVKSEKAVFQKTWMVVVVVIVLVAFRFLIRLEF